MPGSAGSPTPTSPAAWRRSIPAGSSSEMGAFGAFGRMTGAVWALVRNDALLPRELDQAYPPSVATIAKSLRLFAGSGARNGRPGERLARSLEGMGPVATKLGQMLSTRGDFFGREFAEDLGRLKDRLPPFPTAVARAEVERALGKPIEGIHAEFGEPPAPPPPAPGWRGPWQSQSRQSTPSSASPWRRPPWPRRMRPSCSTGARWR